jgi:hypothetical protein
MFPLECFNRFLCTSSLFETVLAFSYFLFFYKNHWKVQELIITFSSKNKRDKDIFHLKQIFSSFTSKEEKKIVHQ